MVGDLTYLQTDEGWAYPAVVLNLSTRMVLGWKTPAQRRSSLVIDALAIARDHGHLEKDAMFHSDRGSQYCDDAFVHWSDRNQVVRSMGSTGVCLDNAATESFFAMSKNELYHRYRYPTRVHARFAVA